uniref:Uncharacterized protein n=1 Tax=Arundo donax TaxID=35708 RepID=A0A0A8Z4W3_ARUDO
MNCNDESGRRSCCQGTNGGGSIRGGAMAARIERWEARAADWEERPCVFVANERC